MRSSEASVNMASMKMRNFLASWGNYFASRIFLFQFGTGWDYVPWYCGLM